MSNINGVGSNQPLNRIAAPKAAEANKPVAGTPGTPRGADKVELSKVADPSLSKLEAKPDVDELRDVKIARLKAEIASGKFETPERIDGTVDKLLADLLD